MPRRTEFTCLACGLPESALPPGHEVIVSEDAYGWPIMICTTAVQRNQYTLVWR